MGNNFVGGGIRLIESLKRSVALFEVCVTGARASSVHKDEIAISICQFTIVLGQGTLMKLELILTEVNPGLSRSSGAIAVGAAHEVVSICGCNLVELNKSG